MELYAKALSFAIPFFLVLILIEEWVARKRGIQINRGMDTISSLSSGMTNTLKNLMGLSVVIVSYGWMVDRIALFEIKSELWIFVAAFIGIDFAGYWGHRFDHVVNAFWNRHIVHHSSEEFNLSCALRQSISSIISIYFFLYIPMALIGVPANIIAIIAPLHLFAQFWYHTRLINRMGFLEHVLVTPSHHRVHHAINKEYLDKNFAQIFIFWDKLFGTFQEEKEDVPAVYGTKRPANTWNPIIINYMHFWALIKDAWHTRNWFDKLRIWFMPTGWRPADVVDRYPLAIIENPYEQVKYDSKPSKNLQLWSWAQLVVHFLLIYHLLTSFGNIQYADVLLYAAFMMVSIFAFTSLMDRHPRAPVFESIKFAFGLFLFSKFGAWFNLGEIIPGAAYIILVYLAASWYASIRFTKLEGRAVFSQNTPLTESNVLEKVRV
jgi:alkylglycerol monooxygenase